MLGVILLIVGAIMLCVGFVSIVAEMGGTPFFIGLFSASAGVACFYFRNGLKEGTTGTTPAPVARLESQVQMSQEQFTKLRSSAVNLFHQLNELCGMESVQALLAMYDGEQFQKLREKTETRFVIDWKLASFALTDVIMCYRQLGYGLDLNRKEGVGMIIFLMLLCSKEAEETTVFNQPLVLSLVKEAGDFIEAFDRVVTIKSPDGSLLVPVIMRKGKIDSEAVDKYCVLFYRFASTMAKIDGNVSGTESEWLCIMPSRLAVRMMWRRSGRRRFRKKIAGKVFLHRKNRNGYVLWSRIRSQVQLRRNLPGWSVSRLSKQRSQN